MEKTSASNVTPAIPPTMYRRFHEDGPAARLRTVSGKCKLCRHPLASVDIRGELLSAANSPAQDKAEELSMILVVSRNNGRTQ